MRLRCRRIGDVEVVYDVSWEIVDIDDATDNVLFIVHRDDDTLVSVPAVDDLIDSMDMDNHVIDMILPEGLLTINN